jgi:hypothetical protein
MNNKDFDSVELMRTIRRKHHDEYDNNPKLRELRLSEIREKFKRIIKSKAYASH